MRRVVITGLGAICGNGSSVDEIWNALVAGSAARSVTFEHLGIDPHAKPYSTAEGPIAAVCGSPHSDKLLAGMLGKNPKHFDRHQLFAFIAAREAMRDTGLVEHELGDRFGCICGTGDGGLYETWDASLRLVDGKTLGVRSNLKQLPNVFAGYLTQEYRLRGPSHVHVTACAASAHALIDAMRCIMLEEADIMLVGGAEAVITPFGVASFASQGAISNESKPFQKGRRGFLMGEGAAMLVLEEFDHARRRGAPIYAEVVGYGATSDGNPKAHIAQPGDGGIRAMRLALDGAAIDFDEVGYINAHGTGTPAGDVNEVDIIKACAGGYAGELPVSSTKGATGHLLGAAGALEAVLSVKMLNEGVVLPTHGLTPDTLDPACAGVKHVMAVAPLESEYVVSNSFGFGGTNASIVLAKM